MSSSDVDRFMKYGTSEEHALFVITQPSSIYLVILIKILLSLIYDIWTFWLFVVTFYFADELMTLSDPHSMFSSSKSLILEISLADKVNAVISNKIFNIENG